jgi:signal peptidase I
MAGRERSVGPLPPTGPDTAGHHRPLWRMARHVVSLAAGIAVGLVALLAAVVAVGSHLSGDGQVRLVGHPVMSVLSGSMAPTIRTGDLIVDTKVTPSQAANLRVGQIITFRAEAGSPKIFTHRIAAVEPAPGGGVAYVTKGDANDSRDGPVTPPANVVGLYHSRIPYGGFVLNALHRPVVFGLLLAAALLWLVSEPLWRWARDPGRPDRPVETKEDDPDS